MIEYIPPYFVITCPKMDFRVKETEAVSKGNNTWHLEDTDDNIKDLLELYDAPEFSAGCKSRILEYRAKAKRTVPYAFPEAHVFIYPPMEMQWKAIHKAWKNTTAALFMEMGCGKTFVAINVAAARYYAGQIHGLLVIAPTSIKPVWEIELEKHCPIEHDTFIMESGKNAKAKAFIEGKHEGMPIFIIGIESLSQGKAFDSALAFVEKQPSMVILDESSRIKNPKAGRTVSAIFLAVRCKYRLILTGTSVTQGIQDLYAQFRFLNWKIIGQKSYFTFARRYCIMGGFDDRKIIGYIGIPELLARIAPYTISCTKKQMMDLPPKVFEKQILEPSTEQKKALKELGDPFQMSTVVDNKLLEVETILERMTRFQQIVGGHFPYKEGKDAMIMRMPGKNPKMDALISVIGDLPEDTKVIIWSRFRPEAEWIVEELNKKWPNQTVTYNGGTPQDERKKILEDFQTDRNVRFFVSNPAMGGIGITLTAATYTIYYSNTFSLEDRMQSEDRNHRKGQDCKVTYIDLVMNHNIDKSMINALRNKKEIADFVSEHLQNIC